MDKNSFDITLDKLSRKTFNSREYKVLSNRLNKLFKEEWRFRDIRIPDDIKVYMREFKNKSIDDIIDSLKNLKS